MLDGTWILDRAELVGKRLPDDGYRGSKLELSRGTYRFQDDRGTYRARLEAGGNAIDVVGAECPNAGKTLPSSYELQGDILRICYDLSGETRPQRFSTEPGTRQFLATYRRERTGS
jgi:uncharacterized protein (TIGR03067 family)